MHAARLRSSPVVPRLQTPSRCTVRPSYELLSPMKLILLRHAKSDWDNPLLADHDRPLNKRGRKSAVALGDWLRQEGHLPDLTLCSSAVRTQETLHLLELTSGQVDIRNRMYHATDSALLALAQQSEAETLLMVGHNPGIGDLAQILPATRLLDGDFDRYPTGACLVIEFDAGVEPRAGQVIAFTTPRRLPEG